jgi:hypothetical protein
LLKVGDAGRQDASNLAGDLVLQCKEIGNRLVKARRPEDLAFGIDELRTHPQPLTSALDAAFHLVAHAEPAGDLTGARGLVFEGRHGMPGHHRKRRKSAQRVNHVLRQSVGEIVAALIRALIDKWDNGDGGPCICLGLSQCLTGSMRAD